MNTKAFMLLLVGVLLLGGGIGGAFAGGIALGKSQGEKAAQSTSTSATTSSLDALRQQFQETLGPGQDSTGRGGLAGTIESVEGNTVTVNTAQGPLQATIGADTTIQTFAEGTLADLEPGLQVTVTGQRAEDGSVQATSILITPEGAVSFPGGGFFPGGTRQWSGQQSP
jgi:hypothetical protein